MEFRGFVFAGRLNALSQYNHLCFFERLPVMEKEISKCIVDFFERELSAPLSSRFDSYIIDFGIVVPSNADTEEPSSVQAFPISADMEIIKVIELNPWQDTTDACMFSWQRDRHILENGPFECRVRDKPAYGAKALISSEWRNLLL